MRIAVIGAGPAGLTAAYQLSKHIGKSVESVDVYEASENVGGMSRSLTKWGQTVDLGPHRFFSRDRRINELWLEVVGKDYDIVNRKTRIFYNNRFFDYPIRAINALEGLGFPEATRCVLSYLKQRVFPVKDTSTFEGWVTSRFGRRLYEIFFKTYSEKLWGIKCSELDSDFASQRIKKFSLSEAIKSALKSTRTTKHATLADKFAYPTGGTGSVYQKMKARIEANGGKIHLNTPVYRVYSQKCNAAGIVLENGKEHEYDHIISTMPLSLLVERLDGIPAQIIETAKSLRFRNTILVYLNINKTDIFPDQWLYIHDSEVKTGRITNFRNWLPDLYGEQETSILCMEYWCNFDDPLWQQNEDSIIDLAVNEAENIGLTDRSLVSDASIFKIPRCYPVYFSGYQEKIVEIQKYLSKINQLHVIGRYGAYKYNNQDHSILMGMLAAENIAMNKDHDLWGINTDYEVYQESTTITKTGLSSE